MSPRDETPKEWTEARALLLHRLSEIEDKTRSLEAKIVQQNETITELKLKIGGIAAGISVAIGILSWLLSNFGITFGRKP